MKAEGEGKSDLFIFLTISEIGINFHVLFTKTGFVFITVSLSSVMSHYFSQLRMTLSSWSKTSDAI